MRSVQAVLSERDGQRLHKSCTRMRGMIWVEQPSYPLSHALTGQETPHAHR
jgi:hypothetical protein